MVNVRTTGDELSCMLPKSVWSAAPGVTSPSAMLTPLPLTPISGMVRPLKLICSCTIPPEPPYQPPAVKARPRSRPAAGRTTPTASQPPAMRVPAPSVAQVEPASVDSSKITSWASGEAPPRSHSTRVGLVKERVWVAASLSSRAMPLRAVPPTAVNLPPTMSTFPSACTAMPRTMPPPMSPASKPVSSEPFAFRRASESRIVELTVAKPPASRIFPSACNARLSTVKLTFGSKPSSAPVTASRRAIRLRVVPFTVVKAPATSTFPSD
jgi:hypothetical protein